MTSLLSNSAWRRNRLLILGYHGISLDSEHEWDGKLYMSAVQFRRRLELLAEGGCAVLALDEAL